jgi:hypothetical protein
MAGDSSMRLGSRRPLVSQGVTRPSLRARTVARGQDPAFRKAAETHGHNGGHRTSRQECLAVSGRSS